MLVAEGSTIAGINFCDAYVLGKCFNTNFIAQDTNEYFVVRVDKTVDFLVMIIGIVVVVYFLFYLQTRKKLRYILLLTEFSHSLRCSCDWLENGYK